MRNWTLAIAVISLLSSAGSSAFAQQPSPPDVDALTTVWPGAASLGVRAIAITPELRAFYGAPTHLGVLVGRIEAHGMAAKAGLAVGDVITAIDGVGISNPLELHTAVESKRPGARIVIEVVRVKRTWRLAAVVPPRSAPKTTPHRDRARWPSDLLDPWTNRPVPPDPWDPRLDDRMERRVRELERRLREVERRLEEES